MTHPIPVSAHEWEHLDREERERDEARELRAMAKILARMDTASCAMLW